MDRISKEAMSLTSRASHAIAELEMIQRQLVVTLTETATILAQARQLRPLEPWRPLGDADRLVRAEPAEDGVLQPLPLEQLPARFDTEQMTPLIDFRRRELPPDQQIANVRDLPAPITKLERSEHEARRSRGEIAAQLMGSQQILATAELELLSQGILEQLERIECFDIAAILTVADDALTIAAIRGSIITPRLQGAQLDQKRSKALRTLIARRQPWIVAELDADTEDLAYLTAMIGDTQALHSWMGIPLIVKDRAIGFLCLFHHEVGFYGPREQARVQIFANQVALSIDNAQLYLAAQQAALEERQRIVLDLHQGLAQTLFSASLIAEALRDVGDLPASERRGMEDLRQLMRSAMAELRVLTT